MRFTIVLRVESRDVPPKEPLDFMAWFAKEDFFLMDVSPYPHRDSIPNPLSTSETDPKEELPDDHPPS